jgi:hypothetical protein
MAPSPQHSARKLSHSRLLLLALLCVAGTACGTTAQSNKVLFEDPRGTVSLQTMSDQAIQTSHPIDLKPALIARVLRGMRVQEYPKFYPETMTGRAIIPVFSPEEVQFLAPLLAEGLRTAASDQRIEYRVQTTRQGSAFESSTTETTAGSLYAYGRQLYVTLSQYRYDPIRAHLDLTSQALPRRVDASGLKYLTLLFTPSAALRSDTGHRPEGGAFTDRFLAIDYQMLQEASPAVATTNAPDAPSHTPEALAQEVETLKKALQSVQQQLDSLTTRSVSP